MLYRLFLYKTSAATADAPAIDIVNRAIAYDSKIDWCGNSADHFMHNFDAENIKKKLENATISENGTPLCRTVVKHSPQNKIEYIFIATSYAVSKKVLIEAHRLAAENDLLLYDAESKRSFFPADLYDDSFVTMKIRAQQINNVILKSQKPIWHLRRLDVSNGMRDKSCAYVVTLRKDIQKSFERRIQEFFECLQGCLVDGEELVTEDKCFTIKRRWYEITYCLESYKKHADKIGFIEQGKVCSALLNRMSCEEAFKWINTYDDEYGDIDARMHFTEMIRAYPNPADRFVKSVNIEKQQLKEKFDIRYSSIGYYGSEILFHAVLDDDYEKATISVLKIEEESATFILPMVYEVCPHFQNRYYLTTNHIAAEAMVEIIDRIKNMKNIIINDTFNESLKPYIKSFNLFVLAKEDATGGLYLNEDKELIKKEPARFVYLHRYEIAHLYDMFIAWADTQLNTYYEDDLMFNIQGP